jgi:hypothetical protein
VTLAANTDAVTALGVADLEQRFTIRDGTITDLTIA